MAKRLARILTVIALSGISVPAAHSAVVTAWVSQSGDSLASVGGWAISEYRDALCVTGSLSDVLCSSGTGDWAVTGASFMLGTTGANSQLWLINGPATASTTFTVSSSAVAFMMDGDWNDGRADFVVDGITVLAGYDLNMLGQKSLIVSGLTNTIHEISVKQLDLTGGADPARCGTSTGSSTDNNVCDHVALFGGAALVPEPSSLALIGVGLAGFGIRRRRKPWSGL